MKHQITKQPAVLHARDVTAMLQIRSNDPHKLMAIGSIVNPLKIDLRNICLPEQTQDIFIKRAELA